MPEGLRVWKNGIVSGVDGPIGGREGAVERAAASTGSYEGDPESQAMFPVIIQRGARAARDIYAGLETIPGEELVRNPGEEAAELVPVPGEQTFESETPTKAIRHIAAANITQRLVTVTPSEVL
jgi:hypothetical protein